MTEHRRHCGISKCYLNSTNKTCNSTPPDTYHRMPRISKRAQVLQSFEDAILYASCAYLLASDTRRTRRMRKMRCILRNSLKCMKSHRYLSREATAGKVNDINRVNIDILEVYIRGYPEAAFLALFRMHKASFWQLVEVLTQAVGEKYWDHRIIADGRNPRPIYISTYCSSTLYAGRRQELHSPLTHYSLPSIRTRITKTYLWLLH